MPTRVLVALAAAIGLAASACTSTDTSVTAPSANKCQVSVSGAPTSFNANGGSGTVTVTAARDCAWSMTTDAAWVTISGARSGQGGASVPYNVAANPTPASRSGAIDVSGQTVGLSQSGAPCRYSLSRSGDSIGAGGGTLSVDVSTMGGCAWTASSNASWLAVASAASGNASATISLSVAANGGAARVGQLNVAGQIYTVNQSGAAPPAPSPAPGPSPAPPPGPNPSPSPAPTPSPGGEVSFFGIVTNVSGKCPNLTFNVSGTVVTTDKQTKFKDISCGDVAKGGRIVQGSGTQTAPGAVNADIVQKAGGDQ